MPDKFTATWVSHSSLSDFMRCPLSYYYKNVYRNPATHHKIQIVSPPLALGSAVHEALEPLASLKVEDRFRTSLLDRFDQAWKNVSGKRGGFLDSKTESEYKQRGEEMLSYVTKNPGPIGRLAVRIKADSDLPQFWLSEDDAIILCGKIDWLEYIQDQDSVRVIDFKTSRREENEASLQLPIYLLLASYTQNRPVIGVSYWYLDKKNGLTERPLMEIDTAKELILTEAKKLKLAKKLERYICPRGEKGCKYCRPLRAVVAGEGEWVGEGGYHQDLYLLPSRESAGLESRSEIL